MKTKTKPLEIWINTAAELKGAKAAIRELDRQIKQAQQIGRGLLRLEQGLKWVGTILEAA